MTTNKSYEVSNILCKEIDSLSHSLKKTSAMSLNYKRHSSMSCAGQFTASFDCDAGRQRD